MAAWCPRCRVFWERERFHFDEKGRPGWRGDFLAAHCRECMRFPPQEAHIYALVYEGSVQYVGSIRGAAVIRRDWHYHSAYTYRVHECPLYQRMRETRWEDWEFRVLQGVMWQQKEVYEQAWCHLLAPEGRLLPPLNVNLPRKGVDYDPKGGMNRRHMFAYDFERDPQGQLRVVVDFERPLYWPGDDWDAEDIKAHFQGIRELPPVPPKNKGSCSNCKDPYHNKAGCTFAEIDAA